jgi:thymidine kinase
VITGPMFSEKTSMLMRYIRRHNIAGEETVIFKPKIDTRYSDQKIVSHDMQELPAIVVPTDKSSCKIILEKSKGIKIVGFDEVQFWKPEVNLHTLLNRLANEGKTVYATLLNLDFTGKPFPNAGILLGMADEINSFQAICNKSIDGRICGRPAMYSQRINENGIALLEGDTIKVGGTEDYAARCREHFKYLRTEAADMGGGTGDGSVPKARRPRYGGVEREYDRLAD